MPRSLKAQKRLIASLSRIVFLLRPPPVAIKKGLLSAASLSQVVAGPLKRQFRICWRASGSPLFTLSKMSSFARCGALESRIYSVSCVSSTRSCKFTGKSLNLFPRSGLSRGASSLPSPNLLRPNSLFKYRMKVVSLCKPSTTIILPSLASATYKTGNGIRIKHDSISRDCFLIDQTKSLSKSGLRIKRCASMRLTTSLTVRCSLRTKTESSG